MSSILFDSELRFKSTSFPVNKILMKTECSLLNDIQDDDNNEKFNLDVDPFQSTLKSVSVEAMRYFILFIHYNKDELAFVRFEELKNNNSFLKHTFTIRYIETEFFKYAYDLKLLMSYLGCEIMNKLRVQLFDSAHNISFLFFWCDNRSGIAPVILNSYFVEYKTLSSEGDLISRLLPLKEMKNSILTPCEFWKAFLDWLKIQSVYNVLFEIFEISDGLFETPPMFGLSLERLKLMKNAKHLCREWSNNYTGSENIRKMLIKDNKRLDK
jgi:hypothetical protein